jgi:hypothetical protein
MELAKTIADLRSVVELISRAILSLERIAESGAKKKKYQPR